MIFGNFMISKIVKYKCGHVGQWSTPPLCLRGIIASSNLVMSAIKTRQLQTYFNDLNYVYSFQVEAPAPLEIEFIECLDSIKTKCSKRVLFDFNN